MRFNITEEFLGSIYKGASVTFQQIVQMAPASADGREPRLVVMSFSAQLDRALKKAGRPCTLRSTENGTTVRILTDQEAADYNARAFNNYGGRQRRRHEHNRDVDISKLSGQERLQHFRNLNVQSRIIVATTMARKDPEFVPCVSRTPKIGQQYDTDASCA